MNSIFTAPTDSPVRDEKLQQPGDFLRVLEAPVAGVLVSTEPGGDPTRLRAGEAWSRCEPWDAIYLTHAAEPGGRVALWIGADERLETGAQFVAVDEAGHTQVNLVTRLDHLLDSIMPFSVDLETGDHHELVGDDRGRLLLAAAGSHGNVWDQANVGIGDLIAVEMRALSHVTIFGNSDTATDLAVRVSQDGVNFYTIDSIAIATAGDFGESFVIAAPFIALENETAAAVITATIAGSS